MNQNTLLIDDDTIKVVAAHVQTDILHRASALRLKNPLILTARLAFKCIIREE